MSAHIKLAFSLPGMQGRFGFDLHILPGKITWKLIQLKQNIIPPFGFFRTHFCNLKQSINRMLPSEIQIKVVKYIIACFPNKSHAKQQEQSVTIKRNQAINTNYRIVEL